MKLYLQFHTSGNANQKSTLDFQIYNLCNSKEMQWKWFKVCKSDFQTEKSLEQVKLFSKFLYVLVHTVTGTKSKFLEKSI